MHHILNAKLEQWKRRRLFARRGRRVAVRVRTSALIWQMRETRAHVTVLLSPTYARLHVIAALRSRHVSRRSSPPLTCSASHRHFAEPHLTLSLVRLSGVALLLTCTTTPTTSTACPPVLLLFSRRILGPLRTTTHIITFFEDS